MTYFIVEGEVSVENKIEGDMLPKCVIKYNSLCYTNIPGTAARNHKKHLQGSGNFIIISDDCSLISYLC